MDAAPRQVMQSYLEPALQHFVELLSPARRANSVAAHSISSMLKVTCCCCLATLQTSYVAYSL